MLLPFGRQKKLCSIMFQRMFSHLLKFQKPSSSCVSSISTSSLSNHQKLFSNNFFIQQKLNVFKLKFFTTTTSSSISKSTCKIKEKFYDTLIVYTSLLHIQSNVYISLQLRKIAQLGLLYRRIYSPNEFHKIFFENLVINNLKLFRFIIRQLKSFQNFLINNVKSNNNNDNGKIFGNLLLSFVTFYAYCWNDDTNRITEEEFDELILDFLKDYDKYSFKKEEDHIEYSKDTADYDVPVPKFGSSKTTTNNDACNNSSSTNQSTPIKDTNNNTDNSTVGSYANMIVNCLQATNNNKVVKDWEKIIEKPNFHVWRKSVDNSTLYQYKVYGSFNDVSAYSFYSVQKDLNYRKEWDKLVIKLDVIDIEPKVPNENPAIYDSGNELVQWIMRYPYPMKNRKYLFVRRSRIDQRKKFIILISRSVSNSPLLKAETDEVQVLDYVSHMVIRPHQNFDEPGFEFMLTYFDDPRASFPSPAYAWMAARGVPEFVQRLHEAALKFSNEKKLDSDIESFHKKWLNHQQNTCDDEMNLFENKSTENNETNSTGQDENNRYSDKMKRFIDKLPEPQIHFDSLIWD